MFPKIFYLNDKMVRPIRCYGGVILAISIDSKFLIKEGENERKVSIALINESNLFQIKEANVVIFYFPSTLMKEAGIDVFENYLKIKNEVLLQKQLISLFNYYKNQEFHLQKALDVLDDILLSFSREVKRGLDVSNELLNSILMYIDRNLNDKITLEDISKQFYISTSNISGLFKQHLNISFYEYITSLRVAKSIHDLRMTKQNIEMIAFNRGYANATNYIVHFKKYIGTTPKKYRMIPNESSFLCLKELDSEWEDIRLHKFDGKSIYKHTHISVNDEEILQSSFSYFNLIDIGGYKNLDFILNEQIFTYKNFDRYKVDSYIYINDAVDNLVTESNEEQSLKIRNLLKTKVSIAIKVNNIKSLQLIEKLVADLHFLESEHFASTNIKNGNILVLLDSKKLKDVNTETIQRSLYGTKVLISLDITDYYLDNEYMIHSQLQELNPDYYYLDFEKVKNIGGMNLKDVQYKINIFLENIKAYKNIIFLNYELLYPKTTVNNIAEFLEVSLYKAV
ncbi:helix-turn-helix transcriptional regulator [Staphylococcus caeli]|uniref:Transcriptional regulator n=1 Tax=Staphylococcus caeli TaxID=2201815 RepID=A0A1D4Q0W4_9STAP|nr:helix-turn-helix transcriptional regulator [Staphylococcus caeli]SCT28809.1 transcriptional regulator [Staphylococcus caeli]SCT33321.1 transcriptional regulator [Staphylococcus caeli]